MTKILVIDDDECFRELLVTILTKHGFETVVAGSGGEGVKIARDHSPQVILCDVRMSGADGYLTLYALRRDKQISMTPFILMSGFPLMATKLPGTERGADGVLSKPFTVEQLLEAIQSAMSGQGRTREAASARLSDLQAAIKTCGGLSAPLQHLLAAAEFIEKSQQDVQPGQLAGLARDIRQTAGRLQRTVNNCRLWARLNQLESDWNGLAELRKHTTNVRAVIEPIAKEVAARLGRTHDLCMQLAEGDAAISGDLLGTLAGELVDNAFRYSSPGSKVWLGANRCRDEYAVSIRDFGPGITAQTLKQFGSPGSLDDVMNQRDGRGLGLAIARRVVEVHQGTLNIYGQKEGGTEIIVMIPAALDGLNAGGSDRNCVFALD
jgi:two-component system sensor histidine kinase/response regulator